MSFFLSATFKIIQIFIERVSYATVFSGFNQGWLDSILRDQHWKKQTTKALPIRYFRDAKMLYLTLHNMLHTGTLSTSTCRSRKPGIRLISVGPVVAWGLRKRFGSGRLQVRLHQVPLRCMAWGALCSLRWWVRVRGYISWCAEVSCHNEENALLSYDESFELQKTWKLLPLSMSALVD